MVVFLATLSEREYPEMMPNKDKCYVFLESILLITVIILAWLVMFIPVMVYFLVSLTMCCAHTCYSLHECCMVLYKEVGSYH